MKVYWEKIAQVPFWNNGAGPLWGRNSAIIARIDQDIIVSLPKLNPKLTNLSRVSPALYIKRGNEPFQLLYEDPDHFSREPMLLLVTKDKDLIMTTNPMLAQPRFDGPAAGDPSRPEMLLFAAAQNYRDPVREVPVWSEDFTFTEHSYRNCAIDQKTGEIILVNQFVEDAEGKFCWTFRDARANYANNGRLVFPVRACYAPLAIQDRQVHVAAVSDIIEPNLAWRAEKLKHLQKNWDYDFRMLLYKYCPDIKQGQFTETICLASRDETCGQIMPLDMHVDKTGVCHVLYSARSIWHPFMRDSFFPQEKFVSSLECASVKDGSVIKRTVLDCDREAQDKAFIKTQYSASFWQLAQGDVKIIYSKWEAPEQAQRQDGYYSSSLAKPEDACQLKLDLPAASFNLAGPRAGNLPADRADLFILAEDTAYYARVELD